MAVTPPSCKVCGSAHWGTDHVWSGPAPKFDGVVNKAPVNKPLLTAGSVREAIAKPSRKDYMRSYMAKRRANAPA